MSGKAQILALCAFGAATLQCAGMNLGLRTAMWCAGLEAENPESPPSGDGNTDVVIDVGGGKSVTVPGAWLDTISERIEAAGDDASEALLEPAANGRKVWECYVLGIDPEDQDDDFKIVEFKMKDGKPEITLNHTKDGSGNSFEDRIKILGRAELNEGEWQEVSAEGNPEHRFFKVGVEMP